jgi:hypothetical protein
MFAEAEVLFAFSDSPLALGSHCGWEVEGLPVWVGWNSIFAAAPPSARVEAVLRE